MNSISLLLFKLRDLSKAHDRLSRGVPDIKSAEVAADNLLREVLDLLKMPEISSLLSELISEARIRLEDNSTDFNGQLEDRKQEFIRKEASLMRQFGASKVDIEKLYDLYKDVQKQQAQFPLGNEALAQTIADIHHSLKTQLAESRTLGRKKKKKRKRKLGQGIASAIFGAGVIIADIQLPALFIFSYGLGGSALHQAFRDIVGEEAE